MEKRDNRLKCIDCAHFTQEYRRGLDGDSLRHGHIGYCMRRPPAPRLVSIRDFMEGVKHTPIAMPPVVDGDCWCGEFTPRAEEKTEQRQGGAMNYLDAECWLAAHRFMPIGYSAYDGSADVWQVGDNSFHMLMRLAHDGGEARWTCELVQNMWTIAMGDDAQTPADALENLVRKIRGWLDGLMEEANEYGLKYRFGVFKIQEEGE